MTETGLRTANAGTRLERAAIFATAFFGHGLGAFMSIAVPLLAVKIGAPAYLIGLAVGARAALAIVLPFRPAG